MTSLPVKGDLDGSTVGHNQGTFKTAIGNLRDFIADLFGTDSGTMKNVHAGLKLADLGAPHNMGVAFTQGGGALTIALKDATASADPSAASPVLVGQRSSSAATALVNQRAVESALSLVIASGATLGQGNSSTEWLYLYLLDNSGTQELAVSATDLGASGIASSTAMSAGATSGDVLYSTSARSSLPFRKVHRFKAPQTSAGTWGAVPTLVEAWPWADAARSTVLPSRSANKILTGAQSGAVVPATGTFTQTFSAAATLGAGWYVDYRNDGTGIITFDPNSTELIDGSQTLNLYTGESCRIVCDGSAFKTVGRTTGMVKIAQAVVGSAVSSVDITAGIDSTFDEYVLVLAGVLPATDDAQLWFRISQDNGSNYKAGSTDYRTNQFVNQNGTITSGSADSNALIVSAAASNAAGDGGVNGEIRFFNPSSSTGKKWIRSVTAHYRTANGTCEWQQGGRYQADNNAWNAIRIFFSTGNIAAGTFTLYGVRK
jgi:hypothetical protein